MRISGTPYFPASALLGLLALLNIVWLRHYAVSTAIAIILYITLMVLAFFAGRAARTKRRQPSLYAGAMGALFGIIAGLGSFLIRDTLTDINVPAHTAVRLKLLAWANSPGGHIAAVLTAMIAFSVISLIVGSIGGFSIKDPQDSSDIA